MEPNIAEAGILSVFGWLTTAWIRGLHDRSDRKPMVSVDPLPVQLATGADIIDCKMGLSGYVRPLLGTGSR